MTKICAIHQPNFFPWLGYFNKIYNSDIFVFLDDVQNTKTGSSFVNRTQLNYLGASKYYTCPIKRPSGLIAINKVEFADANWQNKFLRTIQAYYRKSKNFNKIYNLICDSLTLKKYISLSEFNKDMIKLIAAYLGLNTQFILKSELNIQTHSTQMLIDVCKAVGADTYLCGGGASNYQDDKMFSQQNINLVYQDYHAIPYNEDKKFLPGLSIIDYLMTADSNATIQYYFSIKK